ncbi:MAG: FAD/NAD(P)-binding protein [Pseudomonadota bacterium]|jgi:uncharacterized NAD(P)/FAD-binding protein YdhS|nr:FAD/NAD(P)-binding protein [Pseudomonadota bacterium]
MRRRIAIIGGGAAAAVLLCELLEQPTPRPLHVDWYTGGQHPARGVAYGTASSHHLLNVRAASMGLFDGRRHGFLEFAQRRAPRTAGTDFLPRSWYGDYLQQEVAAALAQGERHGHDAHVIPFAVDSLVPEREGLSVMHGETSHRADAAVLALGALPPRPLPEVGAAALASGRYVVDPWKFLGEPAPSGQPPQDVVLIGMGLTALDVLLELAERWPQTRFIALSRHGLLPEAHLRQATAPSDDGAGLIEAMRDAPDIRQWMRLLREAAAQEPDWRTVIDGLRPHVPALWRDLPMAQRARFLRHANWAWQRVRHRMPPALQEQVSALERDGRLRRLRARVRAVDVAGDALRLTVEVAGQPQRLDAGLVIQATGLDTDVRPTAHRLVSQLLTNLHITPDPLGLGMMAEADGRLLRDGDAWPHLFVIGSLLRGTLWESTAIPEIRQQARRLAGRLRGN